MPPKRTSKSAAKRTAQVRGHRASPDPLTRLQSIQARQEQRKAARRKKGTRRTGDWVSIASTRVHRAQYNPSTGTINVVFADGCLTGDSLVPLASGEWAPISAVQAGDEVWAWSGTGLTPRKVLGQRLAGWEAPVTVETKYLALSATPDHPFLVIPDDGHCRPKFLPEWRPAGLIRPGDLLVTSSKLATSGCPPLPGWDSDERMWLLGFLFGDGWVTTWERRNWNAKYERCYKSRSWAVCCALGVDEALNEEIADAIAAAFGRRPYRDRKGSWRLDCNEGGRTLEALGLKAGVGATQKRLPIWLFGARTGLQRSFIEGLMDADGYDLPGGFAKRLTLANPPLVDDVRRLGLMCGWRSSRGFVKTKLVQPPNSPKPVVTTAKTAVFLPPGKDCRGQSLVKGAIPPDVRVLRVTAVDWEEELQPVYDLTVEGDQSFVAEGFVVHNTPWHYTGVTAEQFRRLREHEHPGAYINTLTAHATAHGFGHT